MAQVLHVAPVNPVEQVGAGVGGAGVGGAVGGTTILRTNVGAVVTNWFVAVPDSVRVTVLVLAVVDVVVTEIVFAALSPADHERDVGLYVTPGTAVGVSLMLAPTRGGLLGSTVTV